MTGGWLIGLRDRPLTERERQSIFLLVCVLLAVAALALTLAHPAAHAAHRAPRSRAALTLQTTPALDAGREVSPSAERAARGFLAGYLAYVYGHGPLASVRGANGSLLRSLAAPAPRVSADMRARRPRLFGLTALPSAHATMRVRALISDGGVADYPLVLLLAREPGSRRRLVVTGIEGE